MSEARWSPGPCQYCDGTGRSFFCQECDAKRPMDCEHALTGDRPRAHSLAYYIDTDMTGPTRYSVECDCGWTASAPDEKQRNEAAEAHLPKSDVLS